MSLEDIIKQNKEKRQQEISAQRQKAAVKKTHLKARDFPKPERKPKPQPQPQASQEQSKTSLFISNLHFGVTNEQLREKVQEFGKLVRLGVNWNKLGKSRGTAEIEYSTTEEATKAMEQLNGTEIEGRKIAVKYSREQSE